MVGAAAEALRNAAAHAYRDKAGGPVVVQLEHTAAGVRVVVTDDGDGFDRERVPATSFGIPISIEDRMAAVHGRGVVSSVPGDGTRVHLSWAPRGGEP
jgi:signal transduction histidine kinase